MLLQMVRFVVFLKNVQVVVLAPRVQHLAQVLRVAPPALHLLACRHPHMSGSGARRLLFESELH